ncbi:Wzz/FepE/Etk N-terminal domain-containing protein [Xylophilus sp.]|uniref:Wzz/FepE/Etk N-terminal domain-containing protein n=1 Tax=Xylophilus sp. TaxID=2653893 RepID=UPI0013BC5800|nr:Wzz/FepE/Etk N-terminal domain-containing protein [Xylophilus sp.]KAF1045983.1 MAG: hypothetical protein GAK38_02686 [Xylophilus sp.]
MLLARRRLVVAVAAATVLLTAAVLAVVPRTWTASSDIYVDYKNTDPIAGRLFSSGQDESYLQTQIDIITSQAVAERVVDNLGLRRTAAYQESVAKVGEDRAYAQLIRAIGENTRAANRRNSRVIEVAFDAGSPADARDYANEIVRSYMALSAQIASSAARSRSEQYNAQLEKLRAEADRIQNELTRYQREAGIVNINEREDVLTSEISSLTAALVAVQNQRQEALGRQRATDALLRSTRPEELPEVSGQPAINDLKSKLSDADRRLSEVTGVLGPNHPRVRSLVAERDALRARIAGEAGAAVAAQRLDPGRLAAQEAELRREIGERQRRLLAQKEQRDRIAAYQRELEGAERVYNAATQKYDELLMAGNISAVNLTVLRAAETPTAATKPKVLPSLAASVVVGTALGLVLALLLEFGRRRLRSRDDLMRGFPLPVLGQIG